MWISRDFGVTWGLAAGVSMSGRTGLARATAPKDMTSYTPPARNVAFAFDERIGYIYRMGGSLNNQCQNVVQFSSDGLTWSTANSPATNFVNPLREYAGGAVDSQGVVYISGGRTCGVYPNVISLEDVWASRDRGRTWERRTPVGQNAPFGYRLVHVMLAYKTKAPLGNKDILLVLGGWTGGIDRNGPSLPLASLTLLLLFPVILCFNLCSLSLFLSFSFSDHLMMQIFGPHRMAV